MEALSQFFSVLQYYLIEILPALAVGFLISGLVHEFISTNWVVRYFGQKGARPIFYATLIGTILPVCCAGALPIAISFYRKGARLGAILAFLVTTPATSIPAMLVTYKLLGSQFMIFLALAVILLGLIMGLIGNLFSFKPKKTENVCEECGLDKEECVCPTNPSLVSRMKSALKFAFWSLPKEIGPHLLLGLVLAALISAVVPLGDLINTYLAGAGGYAFAGIFGLAMYICATASVPLVHAFLVQGINVGAALTLLLVGPITSYSALLVIRKIFGSKVLFVYLAVVLVVALLAGYFFSMIGTGIPALL